MVREDIQQVRTNSRRADNFRKHHHGPSSTEADEWEFFLQRLAVENHCCDSEGARDVCTPKAVLGTVFPIVRFDVAVGEEVIEEVSEELPDYATDYGRKVEERGVCVIEEVRGWSDELRYGCYDANCPGEED